MPTVHEEIKKQRMLMLLFGLVSLFTFLILYFGYFKKEKPINFFEISFSPEVTSSKRKPVGIDFKILENPLLKELEIFPAIEPIQQTGRENPFLPY